MSKMIHRGSDRILWSGEGLKSKPISRKSKPLLLLTLLVFFLMVGPLFYVWSRIRVIQIGYEISNALKEGKGFIDTNKKLRLEIATLKSYTRIERIAMEELRMAKPKPEQVIVIR